MEKQRCKLNCSYGKVSHTLKKKYIFEFKIGKITLQSVLRGCDTGKISKNFIDFRFVQLYFQNNE